MTKRKTKTDGEKIAEKGSKTLFQPRNNAIPELARRIDRAIRKREIAAWDLGNAEGRNGFTLADNPYRPKRKLSRRDQAILSMAAIINRRPA